MIYTMIKTTFTKLPPKEMKYRSSRNYDKDVFYNELRLNLSYAANGNYNKCQQEFELTLDKHLTNKRKIVRSNHKPYINKEQKQQISVRSKLRRIANESGNDEDLLKYRKQRNQVKLLSNKLKNILIRKN